MTEEEVRYVLLVRVTPAATVAAAAYPPSLACLCSHLMVQGGVVGLPCRCAHLAVLTSPPSYLSCLPLLVEVVCTATQLCEAWWRDLPVAVINSVASRLLRLPHAGCSGLCGN